MDTVQFVMLIVVAAITGMASVLDEATSQPASSSAARSS